MKMKLKKKAIKLLKSNVIRFIAYATFLIFLVTHGLSKLRVV